MAKLKLYLDNRRKKADGCYMVMIVLRHNNSACQFSTGIKIKESSWTNGAIIEDSQYNKKLNKILNDRFSYLQLRLLSISATQDISKLTAKQLAALLEPSICNEEQDMQDTSLVRYWKRYVERKEKEETKNVYEQTLLRMKKFCDVKQLHFKDITYTWLCDFDTWMARQGNSVNTRSIHLRNLRAVYNSAIKENVAKYEDYPFRNFVIKKEQTEKRSLTVEQLRALRDAPCESSIKKYVDVFFLIFYLAGINIVDLLNLPPLESGCRIRYRRAKTGILCEMQVPDEAMKIIAKYKGKEHLVNFIETYASKRSFTLRVNQGLQKVGEMHIVNIKARNGATHKAKRYTPIFPNITTYWARHTWATIAADLDIPDAVIDMALGHKSPYPMTDVYVRRNRKKVDEAVRIVIDYVNKG